jgi:hypothetical protein
MKTIVFHIGLPKSASTFFQNFFFPHVKNYKNYTKRLSSEKNELKNLFHNLKNKNKKKNLIKLKNKLKYSNSIFSDESLILDLTKKNDLVLNPQKIIKFLKTNFKEFNIKVILVLREQKQLLKSWHIQKQLEKKTFNIENISYSSLDYCKIVNLFNKAFSKNFLYLYYEELEIDNLKLENKLLKFLNTSLKKKINYTKKINTRKQGIQYDFFYKTLKKITKFLYYSFLVLKQFKISKKLSIIIRNSLLDYPIYDWYKDFFYKSENNYLNMKLNSKKIKKLIKQNKNLIFENKKIRDIYTKQI